MPGARPGPALFELLRGKSVGTRPGPTIPTAAPSAPPSAAPMIPEIPRAALSPAPSVIAQPRISITMSGVWIGVGIAILVAIAGYSIVYKLAYTHGERDATRDITKGAGPITEPLRNDPAIPVNPALVSPAPKQTPQAPAGPSPGAPAGDPRIAGFNYLTIASKLDRDMAERAVAFLTENGVKSFAIPVAKAGSGANNAPTYTVYALQGITRDELRARAPVRTDLEERVARLGKTWQKEHKGQTDFSKTYWDKFGS